MNKLPAQYPDPDFEDDDYEESEDEDYSPDKAILNGQPANEVDPDEEKEIKRLDATYAKFQGRGGLIKTRAQRRAEAEGLIKVETEPKPSAVKGESSVDVDAMWREMNSNVSPPQKSDQPLVKLSESLKTTKSTLASETVENKDVPSESIDTSLAVKTAQALDQKPATTESKLQDETITITRTYKFAGDVRTETKEVPIHSAEGQDFLKQEQLRQELRAKGREPVKRKMSLMEEYQMNKTKKINTLEKSRLDWLGFVDKEGIKEDLTKHNKAGYLDKQDFLSRVDSKREADWHQHEAKSLQ